MKRFIFCMAIFAMMVLAVACDNNKSSNATIQDDKLASITADTTVNGAFNLPQKENKNDQPNTADNKKNNPQPVNTTTPINNVDWNKKIIKTADIQLQLDDYKKFNVTLHSSVNSFGAYIADEKQSENDYRIENAVTIKVPVDQFDNLVNSFAGDGIKITEKNISSEDVTGEIVDTKARTQAKMAVRDKYLELLKQSKNMSEILQVQNEINDIQEDIEAANGRIDYLQHASAFSTVNLDYFQYINGSTSNDEKPDFFTKLLRAFSTGTTVFADLLLFLISIWPFVLALVIFWIYVKKFRIKKA